MTKAKDPVVANAKFGQMEMAFVHFDDESDGIRIVGFTEKPDLHVSFTLSPERAVMLGKEIIERAEKRMEIRDRVRKTQEGKARE